MDGKSYIGQSKYDRIKDRYDGGNWWKWTGNCYLKRAAIKYGIENFEVKILVENVLNFDELNRLEKEYIKNLNTLVPNGYNFLEGGRERSHHEETRMKLAMAHGPKEGYKFKGPDGKIYETRNLTKFCDEHKLSRSMMCYIHSKRYKQHKGWTLPEIILNEKRFISPTGDLFIVKERELRPFCRKFNLHHGAMGDVWNGKLKQFKKWTKAK